MEQKYPHFEIETLGEEQELECEQCKAIREEMNQLFETDGLTYMHPEEE